MQLFHLSDNNINIFKFNLTIKLSIALSSVVSNYF